MAIITEMLVKKSICIFHQFRHVFQGFFAGIVGIAGDAVRALLPLPTPRAIF